MITWATIVALATGAFGYAADNSSILVELAELGGAIALFALVCAAEACTDASSCRAPRRAGRGPPPVRPGRPGRALRRAEELPPPLPRADPAFLRDAGWRPHG